MSEEQIVFVVDDDAATRDSVVSLVQSKGLRAKAFASAEEFLAQLDPAQGGCLVADLKMQGMSGLELQRCLVDRGVTLPVIIVTGFGDVPSAVTAMEAGAVTFMEKPHESRVLWQNIERALELDRQRRKEAAERAAIEARMATLTESEMAVLRMILAGKLNKQIKEELDIGLRTVELRRSNIMKKLGVDSVAEVVRMAVAVGIKPAGEED